MSCDGHSDSDGTHRDTGHSSGSRRAFLGAAGTAATGAFAGCTGVLGGTNDGNTLRVTIWSGHWGDRFEQAIRPIFESRFDADLELNTGWNSLLPKIKAATPDDPPFDVTVTCEPIYFNGRNQGLFEPLRYDENIPNIDDVIPYYKNIRPIKYGAPTDGAPLAILYRDSLSQPVKTWNDFTEPVVQESSGVGIDSGFWIYPLLGAGIDTPAVPGAGELYQEQYHQQLLNTLEEWPVTGWASSGTDIWQQFRNGIIDAAQWYFGQIYYNMDQHEGLSFSMPDANAAYMDNWAVVRGTDNRELGEQFINMLLDPDVQSEWSKTSALFFTNKKMEYADGLAEHLPTNAEEAKKWSIPRWEGLSPYSSKFANNFKQMKTQ